MHGTRALALQNESSRRSRNASMVQEHWHYKMKAPEEAEMHAWYKSIVITK
jgi:hypothetical protein